RPARPGRARSDRAAIRRRAATAAAIAARRRCRISSRVLLGRRDDACPVSARQCRCGEAGRGGTAKRGTMRRFLVAGLGIVASLISLALIINDYRSIIDVFELAEPTGSFGIYFHLGGLAAGLAVILLTACLLLPGSQSAFRSGFAVVAFIPYLL